MCIEPVGDGAMRVTTVIGDSESLRAGGAGALSTRLKRAATRAPARVGAWARAEVEAQAERWALWSPVAFGAGSAIYFGLPRDRIVLDGASPPAGIAPGVAGVSTARQKVTDTVGRPVVGEFNGERIVGRAWPDEVRLWDYPAQVAIAIIMATAAIAAREAFRVMRFNPRSRPEARPDLHPASAARAVPARAGTRGSRASSGSACRSRKGR